MAYTIFARLCDFNHFIHRFISGGTGVISGQTQINGSLAPCRVSLLTADGTRIDFKLTDSSGVYVFTQLAAGGYTIIVEDDAQRVKQPLILYTNVT